MPAQPLPHSCEGAPGSPSPPPPVGRVWAVGPRPAAEPSGTQAWVALLLASLGAERPRGACPLYARSPSRRLGTVSSSAACCSSHAVASRLSASRRLCPRCRTLAAPRLARGMLLLSLAGLDLFLQARRTRTADLGLFSQLACLPVDVPCVWFWAAPPCPGRAGSCLAGPAAGSARMQNARGPRCAEPGPARRLWSRAVRAWGPREAFSCCVSCRLRGVGLREAAAPL